MRNVKGILFVFIVSSFSISNVIAITMTDSFDSYNTADQIYDQDSTMHGSGWNTNTWVDTSAGANYFKATAVGATGTADFSPNGLGSQGYVYRNMPEITLTSDQEITFALKAHGGTDTANCIIGFAMGDSHGTFGFNVGLAFMNSNLQVVSFTNDPWQGVSSPIANVTADVFHNITVNNINYSGLGTFDVSVDGQAAVSVAFMNDINSFERAYILGQNIDGGHGYVDTISITGDAVPEPSSVIFFGMGLLGMIVSGWRRSQSGRQENECKNDNVRDKRREHPYLNNKLRILRSKITGQN